MRRSVTTLWTVALLVACASLNACDWFGPAIDQPYYDWKYGGMPVADRERLFRESTSFRDSEDIISSLAIPDGNSPEEAEEYWKRFGDERAAATTRFFVFIQQGSTDVTKAFQKNLSWYCAVQLCHGRGTRFKERMAYLQQMLDAAATEGIRQDVLEAMDWLRREGRESKRDE